MRRTNPVLFIVLGFAALASVLGVWVVPDHGGDFRAFYQDTAAWWAGRPPPESPDVVNLNHPALFWVFAPFVGLSERTAYTVWVVLSQACGILGAVIIARRLRVSPLDLSIALFALTGSAVALANGQVTFVLLLLMTASWLSARDGHMTRAGAWLGILCALKPFYGLCVLGFLLRREWRAVCSSALSGSLVMLAGWLAVGTEGYQVWIGHLRSVDWTQHIFNGSIRGLVDRWFAVQTIDNTATFTSLAIWPWLTTPLSLILTSFVLWILWRHRHAEVDHWYALFGVSCLLVSPLGWIYYLPVAFGPMVSVVRRSSSSWRWGCLLSVIPYPYLVGVQYGPLGTVLAGGWAWLSLVVIVGLIDDTARSERPIVDSSPGVRRRPSHPRSAGRSVQSGEIRNARNTARSFSDQIMTRSICQIPGCRHDGHAFGTSPATNTAE